MAFENYYVEMPTDPNYFKERWQAAKVDLNFSYGMFDNGKLVGFIIHAIDKRIGILTAFNTGTGVIPDYRGRRIVKSIYEYALNKLSQNGIEKSTLEVITKNNIAIRSYESVGFKVTKRYKCFNGKLDLIENDSFTLLERDLSEVEWDQLPNQEYYSWDNQSETIMESNYKFYQVLNGKRAESYFVINPANGYLSQFDLLSTNDGGWNRLFSGIKQISPNIRINNVDDRQKDKIDFLNSIGLVNSIDQYEMELAINPSNNM